MGWQRGKQHKKRRGTGKQKRTKRQLVSKANRDGDYEAQKGKRQGIERGNAQEAARRERERERED